MTAQASNEFIHICHVSVLIVFLVNGMVDDSVRFPLDSKGEVRKQYGYPEFLKDRVLGITTKVRKPYFFLDQLVIFFHRPSKKVALTEQIFNQAKVICDQCFQCPAWKIEL